MDGMEGNAFVLRFCNSTDAVAGIYARNLLSHLKATVPPGNDMTARLERENPEAQDFGTTLVLVLGAPAAVAVAKGIQSWLKGHSGASLEIRTEQGHVIVRNAESKALADIAEAFVSAIHK